MKRKWYVLIAVLGGFLLSTGKVHPGTSMEKLYQAAKGEGEVVLWSPMDADEVRMLEEAFNQEFPGIKINHFEIRETDYVPRVIAESRQGIVSLDIGTSKYIAAGPLIDRDLIQGYRDWTQIFSDLNPAAVSRDGRFLASDDLAFIVAYNTQLVKPQDVPTSWDDLLAAKWKGKIILEPRANAFAYLGLAWGREKTVNYVRKLAGQAASFVKGGTSTAQQLAAGAGSLAIGAYVYRIMAMRRDGAPVDWARKVSPIGAMPQDVFVMKGALHPNAGKLFAGWLATERAQKLKNAKLFRGALNPGSNYIVMREFDKHNVRVVKESIDNYKEAAEINQLAAKAMGVYR